MRLFLVNVRCNGLLFRQFRWAHNLCWLVHHNNRFHREKMTRIDHFLKFGFSTNRTNCEWYDSRNISSHGCFRAKRRILHRPIGMQLHVQDRQEQTMQMKIRGRVVDSKLFSLFLAEILVLQRFDAVPICNHLRSLYNALRNCSRISWLIPAY